MNGAATPHNFAAQAVRSLRRMVEARKGDPRWECDVLQAHLMAGCIEEAVHFSLPDSGKLFDDDLRGLRGMAPRLPYPVVTMEYVVSKHEPVSDVDVQRQLVDMPKRFILASEMDRATIEQSYASVFGSGKFDSITTSGMRERLNRAAFDHSDRYINVWPMHWLEEVKAWTPYACSWMIPCQRWDDVSKVTFAAGFDSIDYLNQCDEVGITGFPVVQLPGLYSEMERQRGAEMAWRYVTHDLGGEARATLEFCEAMTCSNVEPITLQEACPRNAKRVKDGKVPIYEIKTLAVTVPSMSGRSAASSPFGELSGRNSPRQHLRRGHIRQLSADRRIWVSSCVVGSAEVGRIDKRYVVRAASA